MKLTDEEKAEFFSKWGDGDCWGLNVLRDVINKRSNSEELEELVSAVCELNALNSICECEDWKSFEKFDTRIGDLYYDMKWELFHEVGLTDEDFGY